MAELRAAKEGNVKQAGDMVRPEIGTMRLGGSNLIEQSVRTFSSSPQNGHTHLIDEKEKVGEEQSIRGKVVIVSQAVLKGRKGLLIILERVEILPSTAM